jgi:hypothetical protein
MHRIASILGLIVAASLQLPTTAAIADDACVFDTVDNKLHCTESGTTPGGQRTSNPRPRERAGPRYIYTMTDPVVGDCHYWSNVPGGIDAWNSIYDTDVIAAAQLPNCPVVPPVDAPATAWDIFRSWTLDPPAPALQPLDRGITGLPTFLASPVPVEITYAEILPDGRLLQVRARVSELRIDWGDTTRATFNPSSAGPYPEGTVTHTYRTKTCSAQYRQEHPSGGLCHPTLEYYTISAMNRWAGEYNVGSGWVLLGTLDRTASVAYDIDEVRGVPIPVP